MTTQLVPDRLALPPPLDLDLVDAGRRTGWIADDTVGFRGFRDETEAAHAASVAYRAIARRLARTHGARTVPVGIEPLAIQRVEGREMILASGRPIAALVRPGADSRSGVDSFGFEVSIPTPVTELEARAMAHLMYRTLRKSGIRWALWRPDAAQLTEASTRRTSVATATDVAENVDAGTRDDMERPNPATWKPLAATARVSTDPARTLAVLAVAGAAILAASTPLVMIPLAAVVLAAVMLLRSRRLR